MASMTSFPSVQSALEPEATHAVAGAFGEFRRALKAGRQRAGGHRSRNHWLARRGEGDRVVWGRERGRQ